MKGINSKNEQALQKTAQKRPDLKGLQIRKAGHVGGRKEAKMQHP
jgi:hypothetical protein